ncbi:steroid 17alpha-monooxygenase or 17alpha-hydroxyprogesterone aldolase [Spatholobus suberectus]|nr:steroid 17alpha-monooxygenase or 17alpha-hydroxyprogesterone aldolase [Spatholobus suberectus]
MEAQACFLVIVFSLFLLLNWLAKYFKLKPNVTHKLPPGPKKLPLIGNLHQLAVAGSLPHHALRDLAHKYGPLMHLQLGQISAVVASSPRMAKEITKTHDVAFLHRPQLISTDMLSYGGIDIVFAPYGDYWRQMKKIFVSEFLSAKRVQSFSFIREDETAKFIDSIRTSAGSPINLTSKIFFLINSSVSRAAFGNKSKDQDEFVSLIQKVIAAAGGFDLVDLFPSMKFIHFATRKKAKLEKLYKQVDKVLENIVKEHQERQMKAKEERVKVEDEDLVDVLLRIQQSDTLDIKMTTRNVKALILVSKYRKHFSPFFPSQRVSFNAMETEPLSVWSITFILLLLLPWLAKYYKPILSSVAHKLPPGPRKLPLIGNLHQLALAGSLPHQALRDLAHKYGPLMHLQLGQISAVVASSPRMAKEIMKTHDVAFLQRPLPVPVQILTYGGTDIAFAPYGEYWKQMRKICMLELLSAKKVQAFSFIREHETRKFIESIESSAGSQINLTSRIYKLISASVFRAAFGNMSGHQDEIASLYKQVAEELGGFDLADVFPSMEFIRVITGKKSKLEKLRKRLDKIYDSIVTEHQQKRGRVQVDSVEAEEEDLVDVLLRIQESGSLGINMTTQNIKAVVSN